MTCYTEELKRAVIEQFIKDIRNEDYTSIDELLDYVPANHLGAYLSEEDFENLKAKWNVAQVDWVGQ